MATQTPLVKVDGKYVQLDAADTLDLTTGQRAALFPSQTGNNGKYLSTNGSTLSWETVSGGSGLTQPQVMARSLGC